MFIRSTWFSNEHAWKDNERIYERILISVIKMVMLLCYILRVFKEPKIYILFYNMPSIHTWLNLVYL